MPVATLRFSTLFVCFLSLFLTACDQFEELENIEDVRYSADYALPLIDSRITMNDLLENFEENSSLTVDADGLLRFRYSGDILTRNSGDVFASINETLANFPLIPIIEERQALPFTIPNGVSLDRMELSGGELRYGLPNRYDFPVTISLIISTAKLNGVPLTVTGNLPAYSGSGTPPTITSGDNGFLDLNGYTLSPDNDSLYFELITTGPDGTTYPPSAGTLLNLRDLTFSYAEGYLGEQVYEGGRDTIEIDFFDNWIRGDVYFEQPKITFNFENSFGVPTRSVINVFNIITADGQILPLESSIIQQGIDFPYPELDEVGQIKEAQFLFTRQNSNIDVVLGSQPVAIDYDVNALTNPDGNTGLRGFITDSSYYKVRVDVELPLFGTAVDFVVRDTFDLDLTGYESIESAEFKLIATNGLPLSVELSGTFLDESGNELGQLLSEGERIVGGAPVDAAGEPTMPNRVVTVADFPAPRFSTIRSATRLAVAASFSTTRDDEQSVRLLADQELRLQLGVILRVIKD
ncbi:MAG: hypothetical protein WBA17_08765 [Saprospiraceae bacterium]